METVIALVSQYGLLVLMIVLMYFMMIRPQKKKDQQIQSMRNSLEVGDEITTIGGIIGKIVAIREDKITIETGADRIKMHITKWAVQTKSE